MKIITNSLLLTLGRGGFQIRPDAWAMQKGKIKKKINKKSSSLISYYFLPIGRAQDLGRISNPPLPNISNKVNIENVTLNSLNI